MEVDVEIFHSSKKRWPTSGAKWKVKVSVGFILGEHERNVMAVYPVVAEIFKRPWTWGKNHLFNSALNPICFLSSTPFIKSVSHPSLPQERHPSLYYFLPPFIFVPASLCSSPHAFFHSLTEHLGSRVSVSTLWNFQMCPLELGFFHWCRKHAGLQAETHAWHHPPRRLSKLSSPLNKFTLYTAGAVDTVLTISLQQTHTHTMSVKSADHTGSSWDGGDVWDRSNTSGGTKNTHTQGSTNDLPPESISNMQK